MLDVLQLSPYTDEYSLTSVIKFKGALYRIQILCRRYTFWSYPAGLTIADTPGKQKLKYRRVYLHHFQTTIAEYIHTTPNSIQCHFKQHDFKIISLNCQSLSAKIDNLTILMHNLDNQHLDAGEAEGEGL